MKNQKGLFLVALGLFLAFNTFLCIKSFAQTIEVEICDPEQSGACYDDTGHPIQFGVWVSGEQSE